MSDFLECEFAKDAASGVIKEKMRQVIQKESTKGKRKFAKLSYIMH